MIERDLVKKILAQMITEGETFMTAGENAGDSGNPVVQCIGSRVSGRSGVQV